MISLDQILETKNNSIYNLQNNPECLRLLSIQRSLYRRAKRIQRIVFFVSLIYAVSSVLLMFFLKDTEFFSESKIYSIRLIGSIPFRGNIFCIIAVLYFLFCSFMKDFISKLKRDAAVIQQCFDLSVYSDSLDKNIKEYCFAWNSSALCRIEAEFNYSEPLENMENWYRDYSDLPDIIQVLLCQNENIMWDKKLIKSYRNLVFYCCLIFIFILLFICVIKDVTVTVALSFLGLIIPLMDFLVSIIFNLNSDINRINSLESKMDFIIEKIKYGSTDGLIQDIIAVQYLIFENRKDSYMIPDWFYFVNKTECENQGTRYQKIFKEHFKK